MKRVFIPMASGLLLAVFSLSTQAQDPSSQHYRDTVTFPALGMGDTIFGDPGGGWGALAVSRPFDIFAIADDRFDESTAQQDAVAMCQELGGSDCESRLTFRNTCFALASGGGHWGGASRIRQRSADRVALRNCRKFGGGDQCVIVSRTC